MPAGQHKTVAPGNIGPHILLIAMEAEPSGRFRPSERLFIMLLKLAQHIQHTVEAILAQPLHSIQQLIHTLLRHDASHKQEPHRSVLSRVGGQGIVVQIKKGPIFANFVLADEINRSPAKVQSALLEAMQERQVTIGEETFKLPEPFLVMATQNPIEQEGTYPLPEAQLDRFMLKVVVTYPKKEEERQIIRMNNSGEFPKAHAVINPQDIVKAREVVKDVYMDEKIERYIVDIVYATRTPGDYGLNKVAGFISYGASPRASISLAMASKAYAFIKRRGYVIPEDVRAVCYEVLRHRIGLTYEAEAENVTTDQIISEIINAAEVP